MKNLKGISSLITAILLIVVAVLLIVILLSWSKDFANTSLTTTIEYKKADETILFKPTKLINGTLIFKNISTYPNDQNIIGYKIISDSSHPLLNKINYLSELVILTEGSSQSIRIPFPPEKRFDMQLYTSDNTYIDLKNVTATNVAPVFTSVFGGNAYDLLDKKNHLYQTTDGGYLVLGQTASYGYGNSDIWVLKLNLDGTLDWNKTYGSSCNEYPTSIIETSDNGYLILGGKDCYDSQNLDISLIKLHSDGTLDWNKTFGNSDDEESISLIETSDNHYLVLGNLYSYGSSTNYDIWLLKFNSDGTLDWDKTFGGSNNEYSTSIIETSDNHYLLLGSTYSYGSGNSDVWLLKLTSEGVLDWNKTYGDLYSESPASVVQTSDDSYLVLGDKYYGSSVPDFFLFKISSDGISDWNKTFGGPNNDFFRSVIETSDNHYLVLGQTSSYCAGSTDIWLLKFNPDGTLDWNKTYGDLKYQGSNSIIEANDNGYFIVGINSEVFDPIYDGSNFYIIKTDSSGNVLLEKTIGGRLTEYLNSVIPTTDGGALLGGTTYSFGGTGGYEVNIFIVKISSNGDIPDTSGLPVNIFP